MTIFYISAERSNLTVTENQERTNLLQSNLIELGFRFEVVIGCYREAISDKPSKEVSFRVQTDNQKELERLAFAFQQDAILRQDGTLGTLIDFLNGKQVLIGKLKYHKNEPVGCYTRLTNGKFITFE